MPEGKHKGAVATKLAPEQETSSHISVHPLYTPADLEGWDYERDLSFPDNSLIPAACKPPCTAGGCGPCGSMPAWAMRKNPTAATNIC